MNTAIAFRTKLARKIFDMNFFFSEFAAKVISPYKAIPPHQSAFVDSLNLKGKRVEEILQQHPELGYWTQDKKVDQLPKGKKLLQDAILNFDSFHDIRKMAEFLRLYATTDRTYRACMVYFANIPAKMHEYGYVDENHKFICGDNGEEEAELIDRMYRHLAFKVRMAMPGRWDQEQLVAELHNIL